MCSSSADETTDAEAVVASSAATFAPPDGTLAFNPPLADGLVPLTPGFAPREGLGVSSAGVRAFATLDAVGLLSLSDVAAAVDTRFDGVAGTGASPRAFASEAAVGAYSPDERGSGGIADGVLAREDAAATGVLARGARVEGVFARAVEADGVFERGESVEDGLGRADDPRACEAGVGGLARTGVDVD